MIAGHTCCQVDACFGLFKRLYRRSETETGPTCLADVVDMSACVNSAHRFHDPEQPVRYFQWDAFLIHFFKPLKGISKMHRFLFDSSKPGVLVTHKETLTAPGAQGTLFQKGVTQAVVVAAGLPPMIAPGGLFQERNKYP